MNRYRQAPVAAQIAVRCRDPWPDEALVKISVEHRGCRPDLLGVRVGGTVTWVNLDDEAHVVLSLGGLFRSSALPSAQSFSVRFLRPGVYRYACTLEPRRIGAIVVG